jgi:hypothetical protein
VYVDDFLGLVQGSKARRHSVKNALLHALDSVLRPLDAEDSAHCQEPASLKKMSKGDATWTRIKTILGWILDTLNRTISLPAHRRERIVALLDSMSPTQKHISLKKWQQLLGELRSMAIAIPAAIGLFSVLQAALKNKTTDGQSVRLTRQTHAFLGDFCWLASRPTNIAEIVTDVVPSTRGACDASKKGMGGAHFIPAKQGPLIPLLWRASWPLSVQQRLVSHDNQTGSVNNSELELTASVAHLDVLAQNVDVREHTVHNLSDNAATVSWQRKGASSTVGPVAYLLCLQALHQRHHHYVPLHDFIPGTANWMSDRASRLFNLYDTKLLLYFNSNFLQMLPWRLCQFLCETRSALISAFSTKISDLALLLNEPRQRTRIGDAGKGFVWQTTSTPSCATLKTLSPSSKYSLNDTESDELPPAKTQYDLIPFQMPSVRWARRSPDWGPKTSERMPTAKSTFESTVNFGPIRKKTTRPPG